MSTGILRSPWRVAGLAGAAAVAAAAVAGCGAASSTSGNSAAAAPSASASASGTASASPSPSGGGTASAQSAVMLAAKTASSASSVNGTLSVQATVSSGAGASPGATASTGTSGSSGTGSLTMAGTFQEQVRPSVLASIDISTLQSAGQTLPGGLSEILTPSTLYLKSSALSQELHTTKPWLSVPLSKISQSTGVNLSQSLSSISSNGPLAQSQLLAGAESVREVGSTTLNGVPVTEYTGTIDLSKAAASLSGSSKSQLQQEITAAGLSTATFTVWIDGQHVTRKAVVNETGKTVKETVATTITGINPPVQITPPAASQTSALPSGSLSSGGSTTT